MIAKLAAIKASANKMFNGDSKQDAREAEPTTGELAEQHARQFLCEHGLVFVTQNFRCKFGEIDLIMKDKDTLVFVEVRFRKNNHYGSALDSVTSAKQRKICIAAQHYMQQHAIHESQSIRFDVVGMMPGDVQWIKNAF